MADSLVALDFYGATLLARVGDTPQSTIVVVKSLCEGMHLGWRTQLKKIHRHEVLSKGVVEMTTPSAGGDQIGIGLPLPMIPYWLATVQPNKIKNSTTRAIIIKYQEECARVLFEHFFGKAVAQRTETLTASQIGGIIKSVTKPMMDAIHAIQSDNESLRIGLRKQHEMIKGLTSHLDKTRHITKDYQPILDVLVAKGVEEKGRRGVVISCSARMRKFCAKYTEFSEKGVLETPPGDRNRYHFFVPAIKKWLKEEGNALIEYHKNKGLQNQGIIQFPKTRKRSR